MSKNKEKKTKDKSSAKMSVKDVFPNAGSINNLVKKDAKWSEGAFNRAIQDNVLIVRKINVLSFIYGMSILGWTQDLKDLGNVPYYICLQIGVLFLTLIYYLKTYQNAQVNLKTVRKMRKMLKAGEKVHDKSMVLINYNKINKRLLARFNECIISFCLGCFFGLTASQVLIDGFKMNYQLNHYSKMGFFISSCGIYHFMEFMYKSEYHHLDLNWHDFQIDHSWAYGAAMIMCLVEFGGKQTILSRGQGLEFDGQGKFYKFLWYIEYSQGSKVVTVIGIFSVLIGHFFRIGSMFHAKSNFNHLVQYEKAEDHQLVTTGPYSFSRHPSYFGWFLWSTGTQLVLSNPICYVLWFLACYMFFSDRIEEEEYYLVEFFGEEYVDYALKTPIGIPFVKGNRLWDQLRQEKQEKQE